MLILADMDDGRLGGKLKRFLLRGQVSPGVYAEVSAYVYVTPPNWIDWIGIFKAQLIPTVLRVCLRSSWTFSTTHTKVSRSSGLSLSRQGPERTPVVSAATHNTDRIATSLWHSNRTPYRSGGTGQYMIRFCSSARLIAEVLHKHPSSGTIIQNKNKYSVFLFRQNSPGLKVEPTRLPHLRT